MQSHQSAFGAETSKQHGHRRMPSMGKTMPVTSLLLDFPPPNMSALRSSYTRDGLTPEQECPPLYFNVNEAKSSGSTPLEVAATKAAEESYDSENELQVDQAYELLVSECSSDGESDRRDDDGERADEHISLIGNSIFYTPCLTCTDNAPAELAQRPSAINEMCRRLCTDECRLRLSLAGFVPPAQAVLKSRAALEDYLRESVRNRPAPLLHTYSEDTLKAYPLQQSGDEAKATANLAQADQLPRPTRIAIQRKKFLTELLGPLCDADSDSDSNLADDEAEQQPALLEIVSSIVTPRAAAAASADKKSGIVDAHELAMLKDFREKFEIAEALAKTSAMTSTSQMKQRLAARKLEIELDSAAAAAAGCAREHDSACGSDSATASDKGAAWQPASDSATADMLAATRRQQQANGNDFEPPRDLLLYLVRMGSFNSAPKINNHDSQDDELEIPKGLNTGELLQHVRSLHGDHKPPLLARFFLKPSLATQVASADITDGLRSLKLNSVSRVSCAPITSPQHIRVFQWNILSQSLGQNNDGFVCCPEEALTWDSRKFLIVQEILQHNPDIVCLQEVDHFKFLQNILGTQNYEGIFVPKPDSPCLYIEENNGPDGCAIFYKRDKYELKDYDKRILEVWRVQSNQVVIAANLLVRASGREISVCTTHLKARHGSLLSKLRNEQGRDLLRFVKQFAGSRPLLLCGDFNAEPNEPVYSTILNCDFLKLSSAYAEIKADSDECNNESTDEPDAGGRVQKSIEREPPYTTWKIREDGEECHTIDYVFYSQNELKIKNCLEFPQGDEIGKDRTPSLQYPSDHFSLVCDFELLEVQQKQKSQ